MDEKPLVMGREPEMTLVQFGNPQLVTGDAQFDNVSKGGRSKFTVPQGFLANERKIMKLNKKRLIGAQKCVSVKMAHNDEEILNMISPAREWIDGRKHWRQMVSSVPATNTDVSELKKKMDTLLKTKLAQKTGLCIIRRYIMSQVFDELIRHVIVNCAEKGLLLILVRNDLRQVMGHFERIYTSAIAYGIRKTLQSLKGQHELMRKIEKLKHEVEEEKKIYEEMLPYYHRFQQKYQKSTEEEDKEYYEELDKLVKKKTVLKALVEDSVGPRKVKAKSIAKEKPTLLEKLIHQKTEIKASQLTHMVTHHEEEHHQEIMDEHPESL